MLKIVPSIFNNVVKTLRAYAQASALPRPSVLFTILILYANSMNNIETTIVVDVKDYRLDAF